MINSKLPPVKYQTPVCDVCGCPLTRLEFDPNRGYVCIHCTAAVKDQPPYKLIALAIRTARIRYRGNRDETGTIITVADELVRAFEAIDSKFDKAGFLEDCKP